MATKKISSFLFPFLIVLFTLAACVPAQPAAPAAPTLDGTMWDLAGFGAPDSLTPPVLETKLGTAGSSITLDFSGGQAGGSAGCNSYGTSYMLDGNSIQFSTEGFVTTMMFCDPPEIMDQETRFLGWMQKAETMTLEGDRLTLHTSEGDLVFEKAQRTALEDTNWQLTGIVKGDVVVSTWVDEKISIRFENGQAGGSAGCNTFSAEYILDGEKLAFGPAISTKMACEPEVNERETAFLNALAQVAGYRVERTNLTLLDAGGEELMSFYTGQ